MIKSSLSNEKPVMDILIPWDRKFDNLPEPKSIGATAYVSIMEGSGNFTY